MELKPLNIFYKEPDADRWIPYDRYPRRIIRHLVRGAKRPGGHEMVALNLIKGLEKLSVPYRYNDFKYIKDHPNELACIIGKDYLLDARKWQNPILLGASIFCHPLAYPSLFERHPTIKKVVVPGQWMKDMFAPYYNGKVAVWPVGNDTDEWSPALKKELTTDFLIYDKIRWQYDDYRKSLLDPIKSYLATNGYKFEEIRYLHYMPDDLKEKIGRSKACIFLCEHETQGLAYQQILSTGTPIFAWDRGGFWQDPFLYPDKVKFGPVSSVPYWDEDLCGMKFTGYNEFADKLEVFISKLKDNSYNPRKYIFEHLTLEKCAQQYLEIVEEVNKQLE
jgi:hypothetical protein